MKRSIVFLVVILIVTCSWPVFGAQFKFHGDMNNRFMLYTDRSDWLRSEQQGEINKDPVSATYAEIKYRYWFEAADDENDIKGVYAVEIGGIRFGREGSGKAQGGSYSGDGVNIETRWAYLDFQTPGVERNARWRMGLMPWKVNSFLWQETATGVNFNGAGNDLFNYQLAWIRSIDKLARTEEEDKKNDVDSLFGRVNIEPNDTLKIGLFGLYTGGDNNPADATEFGDVDGRGWLLKQFAGDAKLSIWSIGTDGSFVAGKFNLDWDLIFQGGNIDDVTFDDSEFSGDSSSGDHRLSAYFAHLDAGYKMGNKTKLTYTFWYASGDDDASDKDFNGFLSVDVDRTESMTIFEGPFADDASYFSERPYILDKGLIMNRLAMDYQMNDKLMLGGALMYMLTAKDIKYTDFGGANQKNSDIGFEINGFAKYQLFPRTELAINAGYLFAGDAMDAFEVDNLRDGKSDQNIFVSTMRIRYKF